MAGPASDPESSREPPPRDYPRPRRVHTKSRNGCTVCKQRRIKCDEGRPRCQRCTFSKRDCWYENENPNQYRWPYTNLSPIPHAPDSESTSPSAATTCHPALVPRTPGLFNAMDLSFLHHAECNLAEFMALQGDTKPMINLVLENALQAPYLVDQLLALSALHLSTQSGTLQSIYYQQATELQTRAVIVFNRDKQDISESNHLSSFIFATLLGIHVLADTLANHHDTLTGFTSAFVAYIRLHRGVRTVTQGYWTKILESDLKPLLYMVQWTEKVDQTPTGTEIASMRDFLKTTSGLSSSSLEACLSALDWIQWILNMAAQEPTRADLAIHATMAWPLLIPNDFIDILHRHQPEGLVVLSYYATLLHRHRDFWVFGGSGKALFKLIKHHIGSYWDPAIAKLQGEVARDEDLQDVSWESQRAREKGKERNSQEQVTTQ